MEMTYDIIRDMDFVRDLCSKVHAARKSLGIPVVQPLQSLVLYKADDLEWFLLQPYKKLIQDECNIKEVSWELLFHGDREEFGITTQVSLKYREAGKAFGSRTQEIGKLIRSGGFSVLANGLALDDDSFIENTYIEFKQYIDNDENQKRDYFVDTIGQSFFVLDTMIYSGLYLERIAQEVVKSVNLARRKEGCNVSEVVQAEIYLPESLSVLRDTRFNQKHLEAISKGGKCVPSFTDELPEGFPDEVVVTVARK